MKVVIASKALVVGAYHKKLEELAAHPGIERLVAVVPPAWQEPGGRLLRLEKGSPSDGAYDIRVEPIRFNGNFHAFYWPTLPRVLREVKPDIVHIDEEPYNFATALATWQARRIGARTVFFTWQNLLRRYPPPFSLFERYVFRASGYAIVGNAEAEQVLRTKGYRGPLRLIPQFGVDPALFAPPPDSPPREAPTIGFVARLVEEKGILVLLDAMARVPRPWRLHVVASGPLESAARARAAQLGLADAITWEAGVPSEQMPERLRTFDMLVLPSLTRPNWKEQFGRILVEAMACKVPVVGSNSGEIPNVIGDAGVIVPEGDESALADEISRLLARGAAERRQLGNRGRERVLSRYTYQHIARQTFDVYDELMSSTRRV